MKKLLFTTLLFLSCFGIVRGADTLYEYYEGKLPNITERAEIYGEGYTGTYEQNVELLGRLESPLILGAQPALTAFQGGTGTSSPSGILYGDNTIRLKTLGLGTGLSLSGGVLSSTVPTNWTITAGKLRPTTTISVFMPAGLYATGTVVLDGGSLPVDIGSAADQNGLTIWGNTEIREAGNLTMVGGGNVILQTGGNISFPNGSSWSGDVASRMSWSLAQQLVMDGSSLSADRLVYWQDKSGTIALLSDVFGVAKWATSTTDTTAIHTAEALKVGIGTTSPYAALSVVGSTGVVADKFHATSTTATSTFAGDITQGLGKILTTHAVRSDSSDGVQIFANNYTPVGIFGAGNTSNALFYGGVNIDGATRLATSLTGLLKATAGAVTTASAGTDYEVPLTFGDGLTRTANDVDCDTASGSVFGCLSSADWTTFYNKFTLPSLTSGSVIFSNGTTLAQDNSNFFWDDTNNRLGIGTTTPEARLVTHTTSGNSQVIISTNDDGSVGNPSLLFQGDYDGTPRYAHFGMDTAANVFRIVHGASFAGSENGIAIISNGNVGIASSTPWAKLSVTNTGAGPSFMVEDATSPDSSPFIIDADGKVGIGTTSPYAALSVVGSTGVVADMFHATNTSATSTFGYLTAQRLDSSGSATNTAAQGWNLTAGCFAINGTCVGGSSLTGSGASGRVTFWDGVSSLTSSSTFTWDNSTGRLGIGTAAPASHLESNGGRTTTADSAYFYRTYIGSASGAISGLHVAASFDPSADTAGNNAALYNTASTPVSNTRNFTAAAGLVGAFNEAIHQGSGTMEEMLGQRLLASVAAGAGGVVKRVGINALLASGAGTSITTSRSFEATFSEAGTVGTNQSFYSDASGANADFGLYIANVKNYLAGSLGIASSTPWGVLSVEQNTTNPSFVVSNTGSTTPTFFIGGVNQDGKIGLRTSTPSAMLHLAGASTSTPPLVINPSAFPLDTGTTTDMFVNEMVRHTWTAYLSGLMLDHSSSFFSAATSSYAVPSLNGPEITVVGTTTRAIGTNVIPANFLSVGKTIRVTASGLYSTDIFALTLRLKVKANSTILCDTGANGTANSLTNRGWRLTCDIAVRIIGSGGAVSAQGTAWLSTSATTASIIDMENVGYVSLDTSIAQTLDVTAQFQSGMAQYSIKGMNVTYEIIN